MFKITVEMIILLSLALIARVADGCFVACCCKDTDGSRTCTALPSTHQNRTSSWCSEEIMTSAEGNKVSSCRIESCCCRNGDSAISCHGTMSLSVPPNPHATSDWCGGRNEDTPESTDVIRMDLTSTDAKYINKDALMLYSNVKVLNMDYSKFTEIRSRAFSSLGITSHVEEISLRYNSIAKLDKNAFAGLHKLRKLYLTGNRIKSLPISIFSNTPNIREIWLDENRISELDPLVFFNLTSLDKIELSSNRIRDLQPFPKLAVTTLNLANNGLTKLQSGVIKYLRMLEVLDLGGNRMTELPHDIFSENHYLLHIYLNDNSLTSIAVDTFSHLCRLRSLDLRSNKLTTVHTQWFASIAFNSDERVGSSYGSDQVFDNYPANDGNPWLCDENDVDTMEYAFFMYKICNDTQLRKIKLPQYLNLKCSSGQMLIDVSTCKVNLAKSLTPSEEKQILMQTKSEECRNDTEVPACFFISPYCSGVTPTSPVPERERGPPSQMLVLFIGVAILLTVTLAFVAFRVVRFRASKRQRHLSNSSSGSETEILNPSGQRNIGTPKGIVNPNQEHQILLPFVMHTLQGPSANSDMFPNLGADRMSPDGSSAFNSEAPSSLSGDDSSLSEDTEPKELFNPDETVPKQHKSYAETIPKEHPHLHIRNERVENAYTADCTTRVNYPVENTSPEYVPMAAQRIAPSRAYRQSRTNRLHHPATPLPSHHSYCSIINPAPNVVHPVCFAPNAPDCRPPALPPCCPNCRLHYPPNPLHLPYVEYPDLEQIHPRHRNDQQPLLPNIETSSSDASKEKKKPKKQKNKKKQGKQK